jgi:CheY-like chemotaxis protein
MEENVVQRIFEPFFTTKEMGRGTGLGLAMVFGIIKNHGGNIFVKSQKGQGSTFSLYLPASDKKPVQQEKPQAAPVKGEGTVLLVDDEEIILTVSREILEHLGYTVLLARNGHEALSMYEQNRERITLVILDMIMPDMKGSQTYDGLKEIDPKVRVLLSSGYSLDGQAAELLDRGCNAFIQKPYNSAKLSEKIREVMEKP